MQNPLSLLLVGNQEDPVVGGDYVCVDAENGFSFLLEPGDLFVYVSWRDTCEDRVSCG